MLQIKDIRKEYRTGELVQKALDGVSLNFRDNEFVAILGPSGSGKTTLLNVIGGLDQYDSGDLIINGVSTKKYKDRDWDSYRNHTIGFVFQSYNLIPHQSILSNVELALTISGITKEERTARAADALAKVGLGDQLHKKPAQLSGGQMQRVAIARALVNDPDILLADEPTGALDSATSVQVMDLLKEVASDRLVVMVTHNPELAHEYANRIVELRDGKITNDTNPFLLGAAAAAAPAVHKNLGKSSMNFRTALSLSFNNLKSKLARTILVAFAGSIGIIGIAMILSISNGVDGYIHGIEEDTVREYPLTVSSTSFDMTSLFGIEATENSEEETKAEVTELQTITSMFSMMESNDLRSLKEYIESGESKIYDYSRAIEYSYNIYPQIFRKNDGEYDQVNPDQTRQKMGLSFSSSGMYSSMVSTNVFNELPQDETLYLDDFDVKAGRWPENYNECVVKLSSYGSLSDIALYDLGLKDVDELNDMLSDFAEGENVKVTAEPETFKYEDLVGVKFKMISSSAYYSYDSANGVWVSHESDESYLEDVLDDAETLTVVGVIQPKEDVDFTVLTNEIYYPYELTEHFMKVAADSDVVKEQKAHRSTNILTGKPFGEAGDGVGLDSMFSIDENALANAFQFDTSTLQNAMQAPSMDLSGLINPDDMAQIAPEISQADLGKIISAANLSFTEEQMNTLFSEVMQGFLTYSAQNGNDYTKLQSAFSDYLTSDAARQIIQNDLQEIINQQIENGVGAVDIQGVLEEILEGFPQYLQDKGITDPNDFSSAISDYLASAEVRAKIAGLNSDIQDELGKIELTDAQANKIAADLLAGYAKYAGDNGLPDISNLSSDFSKYIQSAEGQALILQAVSKNVDTSSLQKELSKAMNQYMSQAVATTAEAIVGAMMTTYMEGMSSALDFSNLMTIDTDAFANALGMNMSEEDLQALMTSLMTTGTNSYSGNLSNFGYANEKEPTEIAIYAKDYDSKAKIKDILDNYNETMRENDEEDKAVSYTDIAGALMSSVTSIIDAISYVLIAFVSISLVVSSIMIGVITYISVLERRKEIGILRAIGASKRNIANVFNAETFIIGGLAGLFGVGITELLLIPTNAIIHSVTDANIHASLPVAAGVFLVILSIVLTLIGGIIPSQKAAKSDPVTALRVD